MRACIYILYLSFFSYLHCLFFLIYIFPTHFVFLFSSPIISLYIYVDPLHCNMTYLLLGLLRDDLNEYSYAARLAGLVYGVASGANAILVSKPFEVCRGVKGPL